MKNLFRHILDPEKRLRERLFQLLSVIALAEYVIVTIYDLILGKSSTQNAIMLAGMLLFAVTVTITFKTGRIRIGSTISGLLYFMIYPLTFFSSGGMYGGAPVVFVFALVYVFLITENWERIITMAACIATSGLFYFLSYRYPELLERHTVPAEHIESFLSLMLVVLLLTMLFTFVTEVYKAENRIVQQQKKEIEELSQAQKRFFSSMSHEIRTPVNAIIGFNEMTLREEIPPEVAENSRNIEVAGRVLLHTVNEILDMSRLETGAMEILCGDYRIADMLSDIVSMIWLRADQKGLKFEVHLSPDLPVMLNGDEIRIKQILMNVITNAVKYTREGTVSFTISGKREEAGRILMCYDVTDTGIGIHKENIPFLFSAFQRMDDRNTHAIEGTGLGLSIVKQLLDMMDGTITVESEYGSGSTFRIEIPQLIADDTPVGNVDPAKKPSSGKKQYHSQVINPDLRILVVDDTPMNLMVVKKLLKDTKAAVDTAESGAEALQKTASAHYDVIFMDHQMPEMDGIACLHRIREQQNGLCRDSKIVCLTANAGSDAEQLYRQAGFDGYLVKPIRGKILEEEIARQTVTIHGLSES